MDAPLLDDRYLLLDQLGRGGMATVFRAFDRVRQGVVAIKVQMATAPAGPAHPLSAEFEAWSRVRHPNIAQALDLRVSRGLRRFRGVPYLVLEHARGRPADQVLRPGAASSAVVECFAVQVLRALRQVHAAGLVHRDVKPSNLIAEMAGDRLKGVKLIDFGLASHGGGAGEPGRISGSLPYVAPEALLGLPLDGRADLYGLGITLHVLVTGRLPAKDRTVDEVLRWHFSKQPADPAIWRPSVSARLRRLIRRATERDREDRPASAEAALALLGIAPRRRTTDDLTLVGRAERANLRLALDAIRLGARRRFLLPPSRRLAHDLLREARVWSRIRGIGFHRLRTGPRDGRRSVARTVLRLLLDHGEPARRLARRHGLESWISPGLFPPRTAASVARFILACAKERSLVISLEPAAGRAPLASAVAEYLRLAVDRPTGPRPGRGGLLLLDRSSPRVNPASAPGNSIPG